MKELRNLLVVKPKALALFLMLCLFSTAKAEIIDGPANFRVKPKGDILISLKDGVEVNCFRLENGWFKITFIIKITKSQYDKEQKEYSKGYAVRAGEKLFDLHNKLIGVAVADVPDTLTDAEAYGGIRSPMAYELEFFGYVAKSNIKVNSIPENILDSIIMVKAKYLQFDTLKSFMSKEGYKNQNMINKFLPGFNEYCIYESEDNSPGYRIGLIFENNDLVAIEHSRPTKIKPYKELRLAQGNKVLIVRSPKGITAAALINKISEIFRGAD